MTEKQDNSSIIARLDELGVKALICFHWSDNLFITEIFDREYSDVTPVFIFSTHYEGHKQISELKPGDDAVFFPGSNRKEFEKYQLTGEFPFWSGKL